MPAGANEAFGQGQEIDQGFLKPFRRRLADLVVTRPMLDEGIAVFDELFRRFEQKGHPVSLSPGIGSIAGRGWTYEKSQARRLSTAIPRCGRYRSQPSFSLGPLPLG